MPDFNQADPKKHITDPKNLGANAQYPSHLFKFTPEPSPTSVVVAWKGKEPVHNEIVDAANEADEAAKVKDGYSLKPVLDAPGAKKKDKP